MAFGFAARRVNDTALGAGHGYVFFIMWIESLSFLIIPVSGESCTVNTDCVTTQCGTGSTIVCQHPEGSGISADNGLCTCADDTQGSKAFFSVAVLTFFLAN